MIMIYCGRHQIKLLYANTKRSDVQKKKRPVHPNTYIIFEVVDISFIKNTYQKKKKCPRYLFGNIILGMAYVVRCFGRIAVEILSIFYTICMH